jgi:hypothetical protein
MTLVLDGDEIAADVAGCDAEPLQAARDLFSRLIADYIGS